MIPMNAESMIPRTFRRSSHDLEIANEDLGYFENLSELYEWLRDSRGMAMRRRCED